MTLRKAKSIARHLRLTLRQVCSGDYRVNFRDGNETTAYYTDSLEDTINTAVGMARRRELHHTELETQSGIAGTSGDCRADQRSEPVPLPALMTLGRATHIGSDEQMFGPK